MRCLNISEQERVECIVQFSNRKNITIAAYTKQKWNSRFWPEWKWTFLLLIFQTTTKKNEKFEHDAINFIGFAQFNNYIECNKNFKIIQNK